jgi:hypothetical protein
MIPTESPTNHSQSAHRWQIALTSILGAYYLLLGADALPRAAGFVGIASGLAVWGALRLATHSHRLAVAMLTVGALAFSIVTWWSVITPIIALLILVIGRGALTSHGPHPRQRVPVRSPAPVR